VRAVACAQSFKAGEILTVSEQDESGWWYADLNGKQGFVPNNYLTVVEEGTHTQLGHQSYFVVCAHSHKRHSHSLFSLFFISLDVIGSQLKK
jgi:hypothetical protein